MECFTGVYYDRILFRVFNGSKCATQSKFGVWILVGFFYVSGSGLDFTEVLDP